MAGALPAARVDDFFGHSSALSGVLAGLAVGVLVGVAIVATGGLGAIAIGAAIATTGAAGLAGQAIGETIDGPDTGILQVGSYDVWVNRKAATMTVLASGVCSHDSGGPRLVSSGSATVFVNRQPMARVGDRMDCSAVIRRGSSNVFVGGPSAQVIKPEPEVPTWLGTTMTAMAIGGTIVATGGIAAAYGVGAAVGSLVGGAGGSYLGGLGGQAAASALGFGATGQAVGGVIGGFAGGAVGGGAGFKGGKVAGNRIWANPETPTGVRLGQGTSGGDPVAVAKTNRVNDAVSRMPPDFQTEYAQAKAAGWKKPNGSTWWPPNDGAVGKPSFEELTPGTPVDRYGGEHGSYLGRPGDGIAERALSETPGGDPNNYVVKGKLPVEKADIAPWFEEPGGGEQYRMVDVDAPLDAKGSRPSLSVRDAKKLELLDDAGTP